MATTNEPWFVAERSEALAGLLLTSREDVRVLNERRHEQGTDFLVEVGTGHPPSAPLFVVQVKGTMSSNPEDGMRDVEQRFRGSGDPPYLPACVFVVNVRDNKGFYAWVAEPSVETKGAALQFHETGTFHPLDRAAVDGIIARVNAWYQALHKQLTPA
jgi:hypothetical protein